MAELQFEAADDAPALIAAYDRATRTWALPLTGDFWDAVAEAHRRGHHGQGQRIAILDSAFDLGFAQLAEAAPAGPLQRARAGEPSDHGTAVALLVLAVAPQATLDLYEVVAKGRPDAGATAAALRRVSASPAETVCMSLGVPNPREAVTIPLYDAIAAAADIDAAYAALAASDGATPVVVPRCPASACLCVAANNAHDAQRLVFAAAGNAEASLFCPAVAAQVISVGFQRDARRRVGDVEVAAAMTPSYPQSSVVDASIRQPDNVLGSSFATPLVAGAAALGLDRAALPGFLAAMRLGSYADTLLERDRSEGLSPALKSRMIAFYGRAIELFPHRSALAQEPDHWCIGCGLFGSTLFTNAALAFLSFGQVDFAEQILRVAMQLAPRSADAAANLARVMLAYIERGAPAADHRRLAAEAVQLYDQARALRPGYDGYDTQREAARAILEGWRAFGG